MVLRLLCLLGLQSTKETVRLMREKHPIAEYSFCKASSDAQQLSFNAEQVRKAVMFLRGGSAPGPNGFGGEHLNAAIKLSMLDRQGLGLLTRNWRDCFYSNNKQRFLHYHDQLGLSPLTLSSVWMRLPLLGSGKQHVLLEGLLGGLPRNLLDPLNPSFTRIIHNSQILSKIIEQAGAELCQAQSSLS